MTDLAPGATVDGYLLVARRRDLGPVEVWDARDPSRPDFPVVIHLARLSAGDATVDAVRAEGRARALASPHVRVFEELHLGMVGFAEPLSHVRRPTQVDAEASGAARRAITGVTASRPKRRGLAWLAATIALALVGAAAFTLGRVTARDAPDGPALIPTAFGSGASSAEEATEDSTDPEPAVSSPTPATPLRNVCSAEETDVSTDPQTATCVDLTR